MRGLVTRAVVGTEATIKVIDLATDAISTETVVIDKKFEEDEKAKKLLGVKIKYSVMDIFREYIEFQGLN